MRLLLDTATLLWITHDAPTLSAKARAAYNDADSDLVVSVVSLWEIIVKNRIGKLPLPGTIEDMLRPLRQSRALIVLPLTESAVLQLRDLPDLHRDPFDRMLICQALDEGLTIVTPDAQIAAYPVPTVW